MKCKEAEELVMPYIRDELPDDQLESFLEHVKICNNCMEELEIYYTVDVGIRQLDSGTGTYNIKGALEMALVMSHQRLQKIRILTMIRYGINTLCVISLFVALFLQCRIWWQHGIF